MVEKVIVQLHHGDTAPRMSTATMLEQLFEMPLQMVTLCTTRDTWGLFEL